MGNERSAPPAWGPVREFLSSLLVVLLIPIVPLGLELGFRGHVQDENLCVFAAVYSGSIGGATRDKLVRNMSILLSIISAAMYGFVLAGSAAVLINPSKVCLWVSVIIFVVHAAERYVLYVVQKLEFL